MNKMESKGKWEFIPRDIFTIVTGYLKTETAWKLQSVCKGWKEIIMWLKYNDKLFGTPTFGFMKTIKEWMDEKQLVWNLKNTRMDSESCVLIKQSKLIESIGFFPKSGFVWIEDEVYFKVGKIEKILDKWSWKCLWYYGKNENLIMGPKKEWLFPYSSFTGNEKWLFLLDSTTGEFINKVHFPRDMVSCYAGKYITLFVTINDGFRFSWIKNQNWKENKQNILISLGNYTVSNRPYSIYFSEDVDTVSMASVELAKEPGSTWINLFTIKRDGSMKKSKFEKPQDYLPDNHLSFFGSIVWFKISFGFLFFWDSRNGKTTFILYVGDKIIETTVQFQNKHICTTSKSRSKGKRMVLSIWAGEETLYFATCFYKEDVLDSRKTIHYQLSRNDYEKQECANKVYNSKENILYSLKIASRYQHYVPIPSFIDFSTVPLDGEKKLILYTPFGILKEEMSEKNTKSMVTLITFSEKKKDTLERIKSLFHLI